MEDITEPVHEYDIFISYRRDGGGDTARILNAELRKRGYEVFLDFDELRDGTFERRILRSIEHSKVFLFVLSDHSLDRCVNEDDWVRKEIMYAIKLGKKIVPVHYYEHKFAGFPEGLPEEITKAFYSQQISDIAKGMLFDVSIDKMVADRIMPVVNAESMERLRRFAEYKSEKSGVSIILEVCNLLDQQGLKIVHCPSDFDLGPLKVKETSLAGQFAAMCKKCNIEIKPAPERKPLGSIKPYLIDTKNSKEDPFVLLSFCHTEDLMVECMSLDDYKMMLERLWVNIGNLQLSRDVVNMAAVGGKVVNVGNMNFAIDQRISLIILSFFNRINRGFPFSKCLRLCIHPSEAEQINLANWQNTIIPYLEKLSCIVK